MVNVGLFKRSGQVFSFFLYGELMVLILGGVGCLRTHLDRRVQLGLLKEVPKESLKKDVDDVLRWQEIQTGLRNFNGRIEDLEQRMKNFETQQKESQNRIDLHQELIREPLKAHKDHLKNVEVEIIKLKQAMLILSAQMEKSQKRRGRGVQKQNPFVRAERNFKRQKWTQAIKDYEAYRKKYPKGKNYVEATYKMGLSFQNLNFKKEALSFFQEVVQRFPKSRQAKKARVYLTR